MREDNLNPIIKRIAIKVDCRFKTPALIGSGFGDNTDSDILRYSNGKPFLPGSTVAGTLRSLCPEAKSLFGEKEKESREKKNMQENIISPLWFFDSDLPDSVIELDGVALDRENKVALEQKKYDFEAIDAGAEFTLRLLLTIRQEDDRDNFETLLKKLLGALKSDNMAFGAKTKRGFGRIEYINVYQQSFELTAGNESELKRWLAFEWETHDDWEQASVIDYTSGYSKIEAKLKLDGSIVIRDTRGIYEDSGVREENPTKKNTPDYKHISVNGKPVILGTSWAGAFRSGLYRLLKQKYPEKTEGYLNDVFGYVDEQKDNTAAVSQIIFGASFLEATDCKVEGYRNITRVKIDRFTGGAADGALFTEKPWFGGETTLDMYFRKGREDIKELLLLGLDGIDKGVIQIGGESSIGRGFFKVTTVTVDGEKADIDKAKQNLVSSIQKVGETA